MKSKSRPLFQEHFGLVPVLLLGTALNMLVFATLVNLLGPPVLDKSYTRTIGPSVVPRLGGFDFWVEFS